MGERRKKLLSFIKRKQVEVLTMRDLGGSEMLRLAMLDFLFFEERMITEVFLPLEKLNSKSNTAEIDAAVKNLTEMAKQEDKYIKKVNQAQEVYAAKNGFTIDKEEED